jgi:hypothetical protein
MPAAISCDPNALMQAATCYNDCIPPGMQAAVQTYLIAVMNGGTTDPKVLLAEAIAAGFDKLQGTNAIVDTYLLCSLANK